MVAVTLFLLFIFPTSVSEVFHLHIWLSFVISSFIPSFLTVSLNLPFPKLNTWFLFSALQFVIPHICDCHINSHQSPVPLLFVLFSEDVFRSNQSLSLSLSLSIHLSIYLSLPLSLSLSRARSIRIHFPSSTLSTPLFLSVSL